MKPGIDIVIVDYNTGPYLRECLESIEAHPPRVAALDRVVVVDNASSVPAENLCNGIGLPLLCIRNEINRGFAAACNQGAVGSLADYLLFLNPDTRLTDGALDVPIDFMERRVNSSFGIAGIQLMDDVGRVSKTCSHFPKAAHFVARVFGLDRIFPKWIPSGFMLEWDHMESRPVDTVMGAFFLVRKSLFDALGGFDERFFIYFEEVDFGIRARQSGYQSYYLADVRAYHHGCGASDQVRAERLFYSLQSRIRYAYKHFGTISATGLLAVTLFLEPLSRLALAVSGRSVQNARETLRGFGMLWASLPDTLRTSRRSASPAVPKGQEAQEGRTYGYKR